jgi:Nuclease-related domain
MNRFGSAGMVGDRTQRWNHRPGWDSSGFWQFHAKIREMRDSLPGRWARIQSRREIWEFVGKVRFQLLGMYACMVVVGVVANFGSKRFVAPWWRGAFSGVFATAITMQLVWFVAVWTRGTSRWMGGEAERSVYSMLERMRATGWSAKHNLRFLGTFSDIDHVVIGPGGAFVLETKWQTSSDTEDVFEHRMIEKGIGQVIDSNRVIRLRMQAAAKRKVTFIPVVVIDGGWRGRPDAADSNGVKVVRSEYLKMWLELRPVVFDSVTVSELSAALGNLPALDISPDSLPGDSFVTKFGLEGVFNLCAAALTSFGLAILSLVGAAKLGGWALLLVMAATAVAAVLVERLARSRIEGDSLGLAWLVRSAALGWVSAFALVLVLVAVATIRKQF